MKKFILSILILSISSFCWAQTDENDSIPKSRNRELIIPVSDENDSIPDFSDVELTTPLTVKSFAPNRKSFLKNGKTMLTHNFRLGILFGKDEVMTPDFSGLNDEISEDVDKSSETSTSYGLNLSYRITLTPGKMDSQKRNFQVNPVGFAYSFGIDVSGDLQQTHGFSCDILAAAGIEFGTSKVGFGIDGFVGTGNMSGFMLLEYNGKPELTEIYKESFMALKYGAQIWIKVPSFLGGMLGSQTMGNGKDIRISLRYIYNTMPAPSMDTEMSLFPIFANRGLWGVISFNF